MIIFHIYFNRNLKDSWSEVIRIWLSFVEDSFSLILFGVNVTIFLSLNKHLFIILFIRWWTLIRWLIQVNLLCLNGCFFGLWNLKNLNWQFIYIILNSNWNTICLRAVLFMLLDSMIWESYLLNNIFSLYLVY